MLFFLRWAHIRTKHSFELNGWIYLLIYAYCNYFFWKTLCFHARLSAQTHYKTLMRKSLSQTLLFTAVINVTKANLRTRKLANQPLTTTTKQCVLGNLQATNVTSRVQYQLAGCKKSTKYFIDYHQLGVGGKIFIVVLTIG